MKVVVSFIAVGNELKGDDGVGVYAGRRLEKLGFSVLFAHTTPEAVLSKLPEGELYFIDAAQFEANKPFIIGSAKGNNISTHSYSVDLISRYTGREIKVIGIKTYSHRFGDGLTKKAKKNADLAVEYVLGLSRSAEIS